MVGKGKGADHRDDAQRPSTQKGCQNRCEIVLRLMEQSPGFALSSAGLASLRRNGHGPGIRWSFPPAAPKRPPATFCQPCRVGPAPNDRGENLVRCRTGMSRIELDAAWAQSTRADFSFSLWPPFPLFPYRFVIPSAAVVPRSLFSEPAWQSPKHWSADRSK